MYDITFDEDNSVYWPMTKQNSNIVVDDKAFILFTDIS